MKTAKSNIIVLLVLLTAQIASAYYCPSTGRWLSRDPIGEPGFQALQTAPLPSGIGNSVLHPSGRWVNRDPRAFLRLQERSLLPPYSFVNGNAITGFDILGLYNPISGPGGSVGPGNGLGDPGNFWPQPPQNCCCNSKTIEDGKNELINRYNQAASYLAPYRHAEEAANGGILPEEGDWSCLFVSTMIGEFMAPTPHCWKCHKEDRWRKVFGIYTGHDLNVVVCESQSNTGSSQKIVFDYWHNAPPAGSYNDFIGKYPTPGENADMQFRSTDCSQSQNWKSDSSILNNVAFPTGKPTY